MDSERILTQLRMDGYEVAGTYEDAELVIVNTCGFIDAAKAESLDAIGEALTANGRVIVTGCLGKRERAIGHLSTSVARAPEGQWAEKSQEYLKLLR